MKNTKWISPLMWIIILSFTVAIYRLSKFNLGESVAISLCLYALLLILYLYWFKFYFKFIAPRKEEKLKQEQLEAFEKLIAVARESGDDELLKETQGFYNEFQKSRNTLNK